MLNIEVCVCVCGEGGGGGEGRGGSLYCSFKAKTFCFRRNKKQTTVLNMRKYNFNTFLERKETILDDIPYENWHFK